MRFLDLLNEKSIPQWARCYYDYATAKLIINHAKKVLLILQKMKDFKKVVYLPNTLNTSLMSISDQQLQRESHESEPFSDKFKQFKQYLIQSVNEGNKFFFHFQFLNKNIVFLFCQMKVHQLNKRLDKYQKWTKKVDTNKDAYVVLLSNAFYQGKMLYRMCQVNLMAYKKIQKKHIKNFEQFKLDSPFFAKQRIARTTDQLDTYFIRLQNLYLTTKQLYPKKARTELYEQMEANPLHQSIASYFFGLTNGISISLVILAIIIFAQSEVHSNDDRFSRDFPVWRGIAYIIMYMWIFALNIVLFQKYRVNYQLVFGFKNMTPRAAFALALASGFTFTFLAFFIFYLLDLTSLLISESMVIYYFPLIIWAIIIFYLLCPLPIFNYRGRIFFFKQLLSVVISPCLQIRFNIIFITEQLISFILPFSDFIYSICYYTTQDLENTQQNQCQELLHTAEYFGIAIFSYRMIQSLKYAYVKAQLLNTREMFLVIRCLLNIFMLVISVLSSQERALIIVWIVFVGPVTLYNYYVDLKWDWGLLELDSKNFMLRDFLSYGQSRYYMLMVLNLIFRISALFSLSSTIVFQLDISPLFFLFAIAILEIIRRFFWNMVKVEREHVKNCQNFTVKTDYEEKEQLVISEIYGFLQNDQDEEQHKIDNVRHREQLWNLNEELEKKIILQQQIKNWNSQNKKKLVEIEEEIDQMYRKRKLQ